MAEEAKLDVTTRDISGSAGVRRLRRDGVLPGVVSCDGAESRSVQLNRHDFVQMLRRHTSENLIMDMSIDGSELKKVLLREVQHDPLTEEILHVDFVEISMTKKMRTRIHLSIVGEPIGVTRDGGILEFLLRDLEVECLPGDLVEQIQVEVSALEIGDAIQVDDLVVDPKLTVLTAGDVAVASVSAPRVEEDVVPAEGAVAVDGAEPEVIGAKKEEEDGKGAAKDGKGSAKDG